MARRPTQGDDTDYFSGVEEEIEIQRKRPKFDIDAYNREQAAMAQMDDRDRMEEALSKPRAQASKGKPGIVTKEQLKASGYSNLRDYLNAQRGLTRRGDKSTRDELAGMDRASQARQAAPAAAPKDRKGSEVIAEKQEKAAPKMAKAYQDMSISQGLKDVLASFGLYKRNPEGKNMGDIVKSAAEARAKRIQEEKDSEMATGMKKGGKVMNESKMMKAEGRGMAKANMQKIASKAVKGHEKRMHKMNSGGSVSPASKRADGIAVRGKTRCKIC